MTNTQVRVLITASNPEGFTLSDIAGRIISVMLAIVLVVAVTTFSLLFATQGFINEDVETEVFPARLYETECSGPEICGTPNPPLECTNDVGDPIPCYKAGRYCVPCS